MLRQPLAYALSRARESRMRRASLAGRLILICGDEPLVALEIAKAFTELGARAVTVRSLRDALVAVEDGALSAAILDHTLSDGDSLQLCERLKERNIPFVLHSGHRQPDGASSQQSSSRTTKPPGDSSAFCFGIQ
jgi:CheY-like chemotaxis protein